MYDLSKIKNYILFLKRELKISVTLHPNGNDSIILPSELISFNIHDNPYCVYVKTCSEAQNHCILKQRKIVEKLENGAFCGVCYAGVREFVYPIKNGDKIMGFLCVSGYKTENGDEYINSVSKKYMLSKNKLKAVYASLQDEMPPKSYIDTVINPLCEMLELAYIRTENNEGLKEKFTDKVIRFLKQHHTRNITVDDICNHFGCSRSYISHRFCKSTGKTIREYLTELRIEDAKLLLTNSELTVTEIAYSVGYGDSNYFSNIFKSKTGLSPREYRKRQKETAE